MRKKFGTKAVSILLSLLMVLTTMCFFNPFPAITAEAASVKSADKIMDDLSFFAPEAIYLYPDARSNEITTSTPFQWYVNNNSDGSAKSSYDTTGKIYFKYTKAVNASLSYRFMNESFQTIGGGSIVCDKTTNLGNDTTITVTSGSSPSFAKDVYGCYIEWTLSFTDSVDNQAKKAYAYTYVYKPYIYPVAAGADGGTGTTSGANWAGAVTWINGFHGLTHVASTLAKDWDDRYMNQYTKKNCVPFTNAGTKGYVAGQQTAGIQYNSASGCGNSGVGDYSYTTAGRSFGYALFGNSSGTGYYLQKGDNNNPAYLCQNNADSTTSPISNMEVGKYRENTENVQACVMTNSYGRMYIDTSRYTDLSQIPNLSIGLMVTDDQRSAGNSGTWYIADYSTKTGEGYNTWHKGAGNRSAYYNDYTYRIAGQGDGPTDCRYEETEGLRYAGAWPRTLMGTPNEQASTQMYMAKGFYGNRDKAANTWYYASSHTVVKMQATYYNKANLRTAVNTAIKKMPALGVNGISSGNITSIYFDADTSYKWTALQSAYKAAVLALTKVDGSITNPDTLASNLNAALNALCTKVTVNGNGGSVSGTTSEYINIGTSQKTDYTPKATAQRTGYAFQGWSTSPTGSPLTQVSVGYNNTVYAIWKINSGTLKVNPAGGVWNNSTDITPITKNYNENITIPVPTRVGYRFSGWTRYGTNGTMPSTTGETTYTFGAVNGYSDTIVANWTANTYTVDYDGNGSTGGSTPSSAHTYDKAKSLTLNGYKRSHTVVFNYNNATSGNDVTSAVANAAFAGWSDTSTGPKAYNNGQSVVNLATSGTKTLYAVWTAGSVTLPSPQKIGYTFGGWYTNPSFTGTSYSAGATYSTLSNETLYAKWNTNSYSIRFNSNGGTGTMSDQTVSYGQTVNLNTNIFSFTGRHFIGWATSANGNVTYQNNASVTNLTAENGGIVNLYAKWAFNNYKIRFNSNGGTGSMNDLEMVYGTPKNLTANAFTKTGFAFVGWATAPGGSVVYGNTESVQDLTAQHNGIFDLYAVWKTATFTVTFLDGTAVLKTQTVPYGGAATAPASPSHPESFNSDNHREFAGWNKSFDNVTTDLEVSALYNDVAHTIVDNGSVAATCTEGGVNKTKCSFCNYTSSVNTVPLGHYWSAPVNHAATCTEAGYNTFTCIREGCSEIKQEGDGTPPLGHDFTVTVTDNTATCTDSGLLVMKCSRCNEKTQTVRPALGHNKVIHNPKVADCENDGNIYYVYCTRCEKYFSDEACEHEITAESTIIPKTGHDWGDWTEVTAATCLGEGSKIRVCRNNATHNEIGVIPANGHTEVEIPEIPATCTEPGKSAGKRCTECGVITAEPTVIPAKGHDWDDWTTTVQATCTTNGTETRTCKNDPNHTESNIIPAKGHTEVIDPAVPATCTTTGLTEGKHCSVCDTVIAAQTVTQALGHTYGTWTSNNNGTHTKTCSVCSEGTDGHTVTENCSGGTATCTEKAKCSVCGGEYGDVLGHSFEKEIIDDEHIKTPATCLEQAVYYYSCARCDISAKGIDEEKVFRAGAALGHDFTEMIIDDLHLVSSATCTEKAVYKYDCSRCDTIGEKTFEYGDVLGHAYGAWQHVENTRTHNRVCANDASHFETKDCRFIETVTAPTCLNDGYTTFRCEVCGFTYTDNNTEATGHEYGDWTPNGDGTHTRECTKCASDTEGHTETGDCVYTSEVTLSATCTTDGIRTYTCSVCGHSYTEKIDAVGHAMTKTDAVASNCTFEGNIEYYTCGNCHKLFRDANGTDEITLAETVIPTDPEAHKWGDWIVEGEASCTHGGSKYRVCEWNEAHKETENIPVGEHTPVTIPGKPATCTETGLTDGKKCSVCEEILTPQEVIPKLPHTKGEPSIENRVEATCTAEGGYDTVVRCTVCGTTISSEHFVLDKIPHTPVTIPGKPATCTETGLTDGKKCSVCEEFLTPQEVIPAEGHNEIEDAAVAPTCTETGLSAGKHCDKCNEILVKQEAVPALGHDFKLVDETPATCTENGVKNYKCSRCDETKTETVNATGHVFGEWVIVKEPTETEEGLKRRTCLKCDHFEEEKIPATGTETQERFVKFVNIDKMHYIIHDEGEDYYVYNSALLTYPSNMDLHFSVYTYTNFPYPTYIVKIDGVKVDPDANGVYTVPAGNSLAVVTIEGAVKDDDGSKLSFWELILRFFKKIIAFFGKIFGGSNGDGSGGGSNGGSFGGSNGS